MSELNKIALKIISNGKGILAADESNGTMTKRLEAVNVKSTPENRLAFREILFSSDGMKDFIGGVILYDETINQISSTGKSITDLISSFGAVPGIKVDTGTKDLANSPKEKITEGLDGLRDRLKKYYDIGARFTKWRGVCQISEKYPSELAIHSNAHALARYSALVQECRDITSKDNMEVYKLFKNCSSKISIYNLVTYISGTKPLLKIHNIPIQLINIISIFLPKKYIMKLIVYFADIDYKSEYSFIKERDISEYLIFKKKVD